MIRMTWRRLWTGVVLAALLTACGGGGGGIGEGGTGSFASGPISGFGSVIVNGVHFDDSGARVVDDDGGSLALDDLRLGQVVEIDSGAIDASGTVPVATAREIRVGAVLLGRIDAVDAAASRLTVMDQTVRVTASTVFDDAIRGGLAALAADDIVEVYGFYDSATSAYSASRIERRSGTPQVFKVRGIATAVSAGTRTFRIGTARFTVPGSLTLPTEGQLVRVRVQTDREGGAWVLVASSQQAAPTLRDDDEAEIKGLITRFVSIADFSVDGVPVRTDSGTEFSNGSASLALGARVEVEGRVVGGVVRADEVKFEKEDGGGSESFEVSGRVSDFDAAQQRFVVRNVTIVYDGSTRFDNGAAADLANGATVEVKGQLSADGTELQAQRIKFDD